MRIVYVEDNIANVFLVQRVAKMGAHEVIHYIDGNEFLRKHEQANPDLILMDIQLSGGYSGLDLVRKLRESGKSTPVIAVTAYAMVGDKERCIEAGCDEYMAKPLAIAQMVKLFEEYSKRAEDVAVAVPDIIESEKVEDIDDKSPTPEDNSVVIPDIIAPLPSEPAVTREFPALASVKKTEDSDKDAPETVFDKDSVTDIPEDDLYTAKTQKMHPVQILRDVVSAEKKKDDKKDS